MKQALVFIAISGLFIGSGLGTMAEAAPVQSSGFCAGERLIYAQDLAGITPGGDADTAIVNQRNGVRAITLSQISDDYVIWPNNILVRVVAGDVLHYRGDHHHRLTFDILNTQQQRLLQIQYTGANPSASLAIGQDGFIRFPQGEAAWEYNLLMLCPAASGGQPGNRQPVFAQVGPFSVTAGQVLSFQIFASDPDGDAVSYSAPALPAGASFNVSNRTFNWMPTSAQLGSRNLSFMATDSRGAVATLIVSVTVNPSVLPPPPGNRPPVWSQIPSQITTVGQTLQFTVQASDPDGDVLFYSYSGSGLPGGADFNARTRTFTWSPSPSQVGSFTLQFRVTDGLNNVDMYVPVAVQQQFFQQIYNQPYNQPFYGSPYYGSSYYGNPIYAAGVIYGANQAPVWAQTPDQRVTLGQTLQFTVYAYDPNGDYLTYQAFNVPSGAVFNTATRTFSWQPFGISQISFYQTTFRVSDGINTSDMTVAITVEAAGQPIYTAAITPTIYQPAPPAPIYQPPIQAAAPVVPTAEPKKPSAFAQSIKAFLAAIWALIKSLWFWLILVIILLVLLIRAYRKDREVVVI